MSRIYHLIFAAFLIFLFFACTPSREMGKLYSPDEAEKLFGPVLYSVDVPGTTIAELLKRTDENIMFGFINEQVVILDSHRKLLYPEKAEYKDSDVFTAYSTVIVRELLQSLNSNKGADMEDDNISVEQRREVVSVSTDLQTLESGAKCPPACPD